MALFLTTIAVFILVMLIMAVGVIASDRRIKGSCGGEGGCEFCLLKHRKNCERRQDCEASKSPSADP